MSNPNLILALGKVIIAAAWADGEIAHDEINSLKDLLFRLPDLTGREWAALEMYIDAPVGPGERDRLVEQLRQEVASPSDQALALSALDDMIQADGEVTEAERQVAAEIRAAIESADVGIIGQLGRLIRGPVQRRSTAVADAPNRETYFEDYIKNKVYYGVRRRLDLGQAELEIAEADLRKLSLAGGLMARVAHVDRQVTNEEFDAMIAALRDRWDISREGAAFVAEVAVSEVSADLDYYRLTREFFGSTAPDERQRFLDVLFAVADADGHVSNEEIEEIRAIAHSLKLTHEQFISAKLRIPRDRRAG